MRLLYFAAVVSTASWLAVLLWRKFVAVREVKIIVESSQRTAQVNALERALNAKDPEQDQRQHDGQDPA